MSPDSKVSSPRPFVQAYSLWGSKPSVLVEASVVFVTVGTPLRKEGLIDLVHVGRAARMLGKLTKKENAVRIIVLRSTVVRVLLRISSRGSSDRPPGRRPAA
jgi:hypothetical protein